MQVTTGLWDGQVLQRVRGNVSDAAVAGTCRVAGPVWARVLREDQERPIWRWTPVGRAARGRFTARLRGIPSGGPYQVDLGVGTRPGTAAMPGLSVRDVRVGDVWILGGQSNMQGGGERAAALEAIEPVRAFYMHDQWDVAQDPIHNLWNAVDPVHGGKADAKDPGGKGVGPGVSFGQAMFAYTGVPQGLIVCGHSGASMLQWDPAHRSIGCLCLYGAALRRFRKNGSRVAGIVWYQGESDSMPPECDAYAARMRRLVRAFRRDLGDRRLPFVMVQLGRYCGEHQNPADWNRLQDLQRRLPATIPHLLVVPAIDLILSDPVHVGGRGQQVLGARLAEAMYALQHPRGPLQPPIALKRIRLAVPRGATTATLTVEFDHVVGKLESQGRPLGFSLLRHGTPTPGIFDTRLGANKVCLVTSRPRRDFADKELQHGFGLDPACNIFDSAGRPLPVFGPIPIQS